MIVTVPLFLLKSGRLKFTPDLPKTKLSAIKNLGAGLIEKVSTKYSCSCYGITINIGTEFEDCY